MEIRRATPDDAERCAAVYAPYVTGTAITFELTPPTADEMRARIARAHDWLVAVEDGEVVGYAYAGPYKERPAYRWACEVSVYVAQGHARQGLGRALYTPLFESLAAQGFCTLVAGMTLPNDGSVGLHTAMGFEPVGTWRRIGWKLGGWHDVLWAQREIGDRTDPPAEPRTR